MWLGPFTRDLSSERDLFVLVQLFDLLKCWMVLSDESTLLEERKDVCQFFLVRKLLDIAQELSLRDPSQRVLDPTRGTRKSPTQATTTTAYGPCGDVRIEVDAAALLVILMGGTTVLLGSAMACKEGRRGEGP